MNTNSYLLYKYEIIRIYRVNHHQLDTINETNKIMYDFDPKIEQLVKFEYNIVRRYSREISRHWSSPSSKDNYI